MHFESITISPKEIVDLLNRYNDSIIMAVSPSCNIHKREGSYRVALLYHRHKRVYTGELSDITSANRCALYGLIEGATHITEGKDVIIMTAGSFGFKKAIKYKGVNEGIWNNLFDILGSKGCKSITEIVVQGGGLEIASLCR